MITLRLLGFLLFIGPIAAYAQTLDANPDYSGKPVQDRRWVVKFALLSLFDPDNTIQFGAERMLGRRNAVQGEFGYGWEGMNLWRNAQNTNYGDRETWRGRAEWRHYFSGGPVGRYFALEGFYKQVNALENGTVGVGCETGPCQYYQLYTSPAQKYVWGAHAKIGRQFSLTSNERLLGDLYVGLGFRKRSIERFGLPDSPYYYGSGSSLFDPFTAVSYATLSLAYGIKVGYAF